MDIQRYCHDHTQIFRQIDTLRELSRAGVRENAVRISEIITGTASQPVGIACPVGSDAIGIFWVLRLFRIPFPVVATMVGLIWVVGIIGIDRMRRFGWIVRVLRIFVAIIARRARSGGNIHRKTHE